MTVIRLWSWSTSITPVQHCADSADSCRQFTKATICTHKCLRRLLLSLSCR